MVSVAVPVIVRVGVPEVVAPGSFVGSTFAVGVGVSFADFIVTLRAT
jgi:hypothetical protein